MKQLIILSLFAFISTAQAYTYDPCPYADDIVVATIIMEAGGEYKHGALEAVYEVIMKILDLMVLLSN